MSMEKIKNVPEEWMALLDEMPDLKEHFIYKAGVDEFFDGVPEDFFTGCYEMYFENGYKDYEPFFTCFERGKEVFDNFYEAYGDWDADDDDDEAEPDETEETEPDEAELKEIAKRYIEGINYILSFGDGEGYDFEQMDVRILTREDFREEYDTDEVEDAQDDLEDEIVDIMDNEVFPDYEDNFLLTIDINALPELTCNNNFLSNYILWPIAKIDDVENPFRPYFELWCNSIELYINDDEILIVLED